MLGIVTLFAVVAPSVAAGQDLPVDYQQVANRTSWQWYDLKARLSYCIRRHLQHYQVEIVSPKDAFFQGDNPLTIRLKEEGKEVCAFRADWETVFTRWGDRLYLADYHFAASGCTVIAIDLKNGKELWRSRLRGLGFIVHSIYENSVNIQTDGKAVIVWGNESAGRYVEFLDVVTGKTVGHKVFGRE
jgi:hypothetical protein